MSKNKLSQPYFRDNQWNVDERVNSELSISLNRTFDTRTEADEFIEEYNNKFDPSDREMWVTILNCLYYDEHGDPTSKDTLFKGSTTKGFLFDHFKSIEEQIRHWLEVK